MVMEVEKNGQFEKCWRVEIVVDYMWGVKKKGEVKVFWALEAPGYMVVPFTEMENSIAMTRLQGKDQSALSDFWYLI